MLCLVGAAIGKDNGPFKVLSSGLDAVTGEAQHTTPLGLHDVGHAYQGGTQHSQHVLGVKALGHGGGAHQVGEEHTVTWRCCKPEGRCRPASLARSGAVVISTTASPRVARWPSSAAMALSS